MIENILLKSERGVDYQPLQRLLEQQEWKKADQITKRAILEAAKRTEAGYLDRKSMHNFPGQDLYTIDQLWVKHSNARFGFSVQKDIWLKLGGMIGGETECRLGDQVGWREDSDWLSYDQLSFTRDAPPGHLPFPFWVFAIYCVVDEMEDGHFVFEWGNWLAWYCSVKTFWLNEYN